MVVDNNNKGKGAGAEEWGSSVGCYECGCKQRGLGGQKGSSVGC